MYRIKSNSQHPSSRNQGWSGKKVKSKTCHIPTIFDLGKGGAGGLNFLSILSKMVYTKSLLGFWVSLFELMTIVHLQDSFFSVYGIYNWYAAHQDDLIPVAGQGHWNDPDMVSGVSLQRILPLWPRVGKRRVSSPNLRFLCPLELDGNRFQWKPKGILASGNARLVSASSDFLKTRMVRIHTSPPSFSYSKSAVHLISHLDKCLTPPPHVSGYFWKRRFFLSFRKKCVYTWRIRIVFGCPHENGKTIEIRLPPFSCVHTNTISRHFQ